MHMGIPSYTTDLVIQFQATPMCLELLKTVFAHLADTIQTDGKGGRSNQNPHGHSQSLLFEKRCGKSVTGQLHIG